jgi:hypothetical protein
MSGQYNTYLIKMHLPDKQRLNAKIIWIFLLRSLWAFLNIIILIHVCIYTMFYFTIDEAYYIINDEV